jgi:thymidylate kinase
MKRIVILEGPDGAGKTTLAQRYAEAGARVVHLDRYPGVKSLARIHLAAMLPALSGVSDIVLDRAWITEWIYGDVYRGGKVRINSERRAELEAIASFCETKVILCLPPLEACLETFRKRREREYLKDEEALRQVWQTYDFRYSSGILTSLPVELHDYTRGAA